MLKTIRQEKFGWLAILGLAVAAVIGFARLTESPPVWYDEGIFTEVAINLAAGAGHVLQTGPGEYIPGQAITTGLTVTYPISLVFRLWGVSLVAARVPMVLYLLLAVAAAFIVVHKIFGFKSALYALFLVVSFAPLYGDGKSVMGEVPGVFYLLLLIYAAARLEQEPAPRLVNYIIAGLAAGLCAITKPTFLVLLPVLAVVAVIYRRRLLQSPKGFFIGAVSAIVPLAIWILVQYSGPAQLNVFAHYANPNSINLWVAAQKNIRLFLTELQPAYFLGLLAIWTAALIFKRRQKISLGEAIAYGFSLVTWLVFFRTKGYYRYFFPGQLVAIIFFPAALFAIKDKLAAIWPARQAKLAQAARACLFILIIFQFYQTFFNSWIAQYWNGVNSAELKSYYNTLKPTETILLYDVPETAVFLPSHMPYYQYLKISDDIIVGRNNLDRVAAKIPDKIIMSGLFWSQNQDKFLGYAPVSTTLSRYVVLERVE